MGSGSEEIIKKRIKIGTNIRMYELPPSGIQNFIRGLFTQLTSAYPQYEFTFFSTGIKKIEEKSEYITARSFLIDFLAKINPLLINVFFDNIYILRLIYPAKLDIFIGSSYILPIFKPKHTKYITIIYDLSYLTYIHSRFNPYINLVLYMKYAVPFAIRKADIVVVPSYFVKNQIIKEFGTDKEKIVVVYGGKDEYFYKIKDNKGYERLKKTYAITQPYCFTNATNHERKNIFGLVNAFKHIERLSEMQLIITGLLPEETINELKNHIKSLGLTKKVKFLGYVTKEELRLLYSYAKTFVFPSFEEGFGFPILEAAACGCLPICSSTGALPELLGSKRFLFNPRDEEAITRKINEVVSLSKTEYDAELKIVIEHTQKFTWKNTANKYNHLFQKVL
ncbi:glycosyltransferase [soil metagenome]